MYELDRKKFGAFVSLLRKEKGLTQKQMAAQLHISDKAISKWETGVSIPDTALLIPLAELLGVTVTELLMSERVQKNDRLDTGEVESIVKTAIRYSDQKSLRAYQHKSKWHIIYFLCLAIGAGGLYLDWVFGLFYSTVLILVLLGILFGGYFCFFVPDRLPSFYDENQISFIADGPVQMNMAGLHFNNNNWPYIVRVSCIWTCSMVAGIPLALLAVGLLVPGWLDVVAYGVMSALFLLGLFVPIYVVGKKYE